MSTVQQIRALEAAGIPPEQILMVLKEMSGLMPPTPAPPPVNVKARALNKPGHVGGYLLTYGSALDVDRHRRYFSKSTFFGLQAYSVLPLYWGHGLKTSETREQIGSLLALQKDRYGVKVLDAVLNLEIPFARQVWHDVQKGRCYWSPSANPFVSETDGAYVSRFQIIEGSLTYSPAGKIDGDAFTTYAQRVADGNEAYKRTARAILERLGVKDPDYLASLLPDPY